jgi:hypothetical protein
MLFHTARTSWEIFEDARHCKILTQCFISGWFCIYAEQCAPSTSWSGCIPGTILLAGPTVWYLSSRGSQLVCWFYLCLPLFTFHIRVENGNGDFWCRQFWVQVCPSSPTHPAKTSSSLIPLWQDRQFDDMDMVRLCECYDYKNPIIQNEIMWSCGSGVCQLCAKHNQTDSVYCDLVHNGRHKLPSAGDDKEMKECRNLGRKKQTDICSMIFREW